MKKLMLAVALLISSLSLRAQNTGTGMPAFGSFTSGGFDTINNQDLNVLFSIPLVSSSGRGMPLNLSLTYNSQIYQIYEGGWFPAVPGGPLGWILPTTGYVTYSSTSSTFRCGTTYGVQTRYYNYAFVDVIGTVHPVPSISFVHYSCGTPWSGAMSGTASDSSGYYVDASVLHPSATVTAPNGAKSLNPIYSMADTNGNYITLTTVSSTETDWTDSVGNKAAKVIYNPNSSSPTSVQIEFLDGSGNYQTMTLKYQSYAIKTNFGCGTPTDYTGTAYLPYELDIPSPASGTLTYKFTYEQTPGGYSGRLQQVTLPTGGYYKYTYNGANGGISCADGTTLNMTRTVGDGTNSAQWTFVRNTSAKTTTVTTPQLVDTPNANATVYTFNSLGQETQRQIYSTTTISGTPLRTIQTGWATNGTPQDLDTWLEDGKTQSHVSTSYDSNGILDSVSQSDWGPSGPGPILRTTAYFYQTNTNYTTRNILNLVIKKTITDGSGTLQYRQDTAYDGPTITNCPTNVPQHDDTDYPCSMIYRGNPTSITTYTSPSVPSGGITKNFTYDIFGNLLTAQLNCCQSKTWNYSAATQYSQPDSVVSGTSPTLTTQYQYNLYLGLVKNATDPNNLVTNYSYDFLRRPTQVAVVNGSTNGQSISYAYNDTTFTTTTIATIDSSKSIQQITGVDGLGRPNLSTIEDINNNVISNTSAKNDLIGRVYSTSNPYVGSASYWTTSSFDVLGRPVTVTLPDNSPNGYSYAEQYTTVTDPAGKQRKSQLDGVGRLVAVFEPDSTNSWNLTQQTSYGYNVLDELTSVTQGSQARSYSYDALGRLLSATTPEGGKTCFGTVTGTTCNANGYDNFNNLLYRTDARGVLTSYGYDGLNRLSTVSYATSGTTAQPTASLGFTYGTNASQLNNGLLITMTDGVGSENYSYNALEQMTQLQKIINNTTYSTSYAYNVAGDLAQITYPSGRVIQQSVDAIGRLCEIAPSTTGCGTASSPYATGYSYNVASQVTGFKYGNGIFASVGFSPDRLQLNCLDYSTTNRNGSCAHDSTTKFGLTYAYGSVGSNNGQITSITDSVDNGRSVAYAYDPLYRLNTAVTTGSANYPAWGLQETYDRYGNRWSQTAISGCSGITCPQPSVSVSATTNQIIGPPYAYDASGNMINDGVNTITYDAENHAVSSSGALGSGTYTYDGNGTRVIKTSGGTTTVYARSGGHVIAEYQNGTAPSSPTYEWVYSGNQMLAIIGGGSTFYFHYDHLSPRVRTSSSGAVYDQRATFPFGELWYTSSANPGFLFTSYERDYESNNDYAMARVYTNRLGRFSSADPIQGNPSDPQTLPRYTYARNVPTSFTDPSGMLLVSDCDPINDPTCDPGGSGGFDPCSPKGSFGASTPPGPCGDPNAGLGDPQFGPNSKAPTTGALVNSAIARALQALKNSDCAKFIAGVSGADPAQVLSELLVGNPNYGTIQVANLGDPFPVPEGYASVNATTARVPAPSQNLGIFNGDQVMTVGNTATITINSNPGAQFSSGPFYDQDQASRNAVTILHELGHAINDIYGTVLGAGNFGSPFGAGNPSGIVQDSLTPAGQARSHWNTALVRTLCF